MALICKATFNIIIELREEILDIVKLIIESWNNIDGNIYTTNEIFEWIKKLNESTIVNIRECSINDSSFWFYDDYNGEILNRKRSFFSIKGMRRFEDNEFTGEQPIIVQPEIGYLGIICKEIKGVLNFLMQAKIEPGNINCVQISPTIQATKSNFTRAHGGNLPAYFELFEKSYQHYVIYDQIQSEQAGRFYKKRNRNMIMIVNEEFNIYPNFRWMTLGQIKELMKVNNLVNMDTRTVLSGLPLSICMFDISLKKNVENLFRDKALYKSIFDYDIQQNLPQISCKVNDYKMFKEVKVVPVPLNQLVDWEIDEFGITCKKHANFMVRYYDIEISGREVQKWTQPLFKAIGVAVFGLITRIHNNKREFLVRLKPEIGVFDKVEIGPSIQWEPSHYLYDDDIVGKVFREKWESKQGIMNDVILSEEGGRFYHEQNRNVILEIKETDLLYIPDEYIWTSYSTLNYIIQTSNCLNIQLRNLISLVNI